MSSPPPLLPITLILIAPVPFLAVPLFLILMGVKSFLGLSARTNTCLKECQGMLGNTTEGDIMLGQTAEALNVIVLSEQSNAVFFPPV